MYESNMKMEILEFPEGMRGIHNANGRPLQASEFIYRVKLA